MMAAREEGCKKIEKPKGIKGPRRVFSRYVLIKVLGRGLCEDGQKAALLTGTCGGVIEVSAVVGRSKD